MVQKTYIQKSYKSFYITGFIIFIFLCKIFFLSFFSSVFLNIAYPLWTFRDTMIKKTKNILGYFELKNSLIKENDNLKKQLDEIKVINSDLSAKIELIENVKYNIKTNEGFNLRVVSKPPISSYDIFVLKKDNNEQINIGDYAYVGNIFIGNVISTDNYFVRVKIISSSDNVLTGAIARNGNQIELSGLGGGGFISIQPKDFDVLIGDSILDRFSGNSIGQVVDTYKTDDNSFKKILVRLPVSIFDIKWVRIEKSVY